MKPIVSINIPVFNRSSMLRECVESFIVQSFTDFELIVADDGSTEDLTFVKNIDKRVRYLRQNKKGQSAARNLAISNSFGEYILQFDSDDIASHKDFLSEMVRLIDDFDAIYSDHFIIREDGSRGIVRLHSVNDSQYETMLNKQYIPNPGTLWKKDKIPKYDETLESAIDLELFLTALERGIRFRHVNKRLWTLRTGHPRETGTRMQEECCDRILKKRGYYFDKNKREGFKI